MCRITSVSGRSADQQRVSFGNSSLCQTHQWFCFRVFHSCVVTSRTLVLISSFVFLRAALCKKQKNHRIVHTSKAQQGVAQVGRTRLDALRLVLWKGPDGVWSQHIRVACLQVRRTRNGWGLLSVVSTGATRQHSLILRHSARADWLPHIGVVEQMQVGTVRMAQHRVTLTGLKHSGDNDDQAFLLFDGRDANLCCV